MSPASYRTAPPRTTMIPTRPKPNKWGTSDDLDRAPHAVQVVAGEVAPEQQIPLAERERRADRLTRRDRDLPRARGVDRLGPELVRDLHGLVPDDELVIDRVRVRDEETHRFAGLDIDRVQREGRVVDPDRHRPNGRRGGRRRARGERCERDREEASS